MVRRRGSACALLPGLILLTVGFGSAGDGGHTYKVTHSKDGSVHEGVLTVDSSGVSYSESRDPSDNFHFSCADFLAGASVKRSADGSTLQVPARWRGRRLRSDEEDLTVENLFPLIQVGCKQGGSSEKASPDLPVLKRQVWYPEPWGNHPGTLSVIQAHVQFSDSDQGYSGLYRFTLTCQDFLSRTAVKASTWRDPVPSLRVADSGAPTTDYAGHQTRLPLDLMTDPARHNKDAVAGLYQEIRDACRAQQPKVAEQLLSQQEELKREEEVAAHGGEVSYAIGSFNITSDPSARRHWRLLTVRGAQVVLGRGLNDASDLIISCRDFLDGAKYELLPDHGLDPPGGVPKMDGLHPPRGVPTLFAHQRQLQIMPDSLVRVTGYVDAVFMQIKTACGTQQLSVDAKRQIDFREGMAAALRAADEPDPFSSIRGDFDLSGSDSRQWKTSLLLAGAEKCALLKSAPGAQTSSPSWTFACAFNSSLQSYENIVKSVQSVVNLPYQPDERAVNINQVFFADPAKPARRAFVARLNPATVGVSVVAVPTGGTAPANPSAAPFVGVTTMLPVEPTIGEEIERIRSGGNYTPLPSIQPTSSGSLRNGMATLEVKNGTAYALTALFSGPIERRIEVPAGQSASIDLPPGAYKVVGRVNAPNVLPSYGEHSFTATGAGIEFYIK